MGCPSTRETKTARSGRRGGSDSIASVPAAGVAGLVCTALSRVDVVAFTPMVTWFSIAGGGGFCIVGVVGASDGDFDAASFLSVSFS